MKFARFLARRVLWSVFVFWAVGSVTYVIVVNMPSMSLSAPEYLDIEYIAWIIDYMTFDWGQGVMAAFAQTIPVTLAYLVPALVISVGGGIAFGTYAATKHGGVLDRLTAVLGALGIGFPVFWLAAVTGIVVFKLFEWLAVFHPRLGFWHPVNLGRLVIPIGIVTLSLFAVQVYYARSAAASRVDEPFVKVVRAKRWESASGGPSRVADGVAPAVFAVFHRIIWYGVSECGRHRVGSGHRRRCGSDAP